MSISDSDLEFLNSEAELLDQIIASLTEQLDQNCAKRKDQTDLARELTSEIVNTTRAEEKVQIYSDEAVAHGLAKKAKNDIKILEDAIEEPYFARIELLEDTADGQTKQIEYKLGKNSNPDCRIIDWRKAPIAKLYYDYNEGDFYSEEIQGQDRSGEVTLKNSYEISDRQIQKITCSRGTFKQSADSWEKAEQQAGPRSSYSELPDILALITSEQFGTITHDPEVPVIIQGVAGSGKTVVAIHRLAWLLHEDNSSIQPEKVLFTLKSKALAQYVTNTIQNLDENEAINFLQWELFLKQLSKKTELKADLEFPHDSASIGLKRLLYSKAFCSVLERNTSDQVVNFNQAIDLILTTLKQHKEIIAADNTKLLTENLISATFDRISEYHQDNCYDVATCVMAFNLLRLNTPSKFAKLYQHLIIDEIQDFSGPELDLVFATLDNPKHVTLLGDINQNIASDFTFPGWNYLKNKIGIANDAEIIQLKVSHRSTFPIMRLAETISGLEYSASGRAGKNPIHFQCRNEDQALNAAIHWLKTAQEKYPTALTAIICPNVYSAKDLHSLLRPNFEQSVRLLEQNLSFAAGIIIADVQQLKGLEFFNVMLWDVSAKNYPENQISKKLLYVATTRAEENLSFISWSKPSPLISKVSSKYIRKFAFEN